MTKEFPGYQDEDKYNAWEKKLKESIVKHNAIIDIPEYGEDRCGLTVHFLTCNKVKVTTSCWKYGAEKYPIKDPREMKEPQICPK